MKQLFSPWRSQYIETFKDERKNHGCLFCRISKQRKDRQNLIVSREKKCFIVLNRFPYNSGHCLIVPYRHIPDFSKLSDEEKLDLMNVSTKCLEALTQSFKPQGFNFGANIGRAAGAGIDKHIHFHIVPRWNGDTNFMPLLSETKLVSEDIGKTLEVLSKMLNSKE